MIKRMIWDLDFTLAVRDEVSEKKFLNAHCSEAEILELFSLLDSYEDVYSQFNVESFARYCCLTTGKNYSTDFFREWFSVHINHPGRVIEGAEDVLSTLKNRGVSNVVCTNDITSYQQERLDKLGLLPYIDQVYGGDIMLKPNVEIYKKAMGDYLPDECGMIGDNLVNDVCVPRSLGIQAYHFNPDSSCPYSVKRLEKVKELVL